MIETTTNQDSSNYKKAYSYAVKLLTRRDYSCYKLGKKLKDQGFEEELITPLLSELQDLKYLREDFYADAKIKGFMHKGYSPDHIQTKLASENVFVDIAVINNIFNDYKQTTTFQLEYLIEKKIRYKGKDVLFDFNFRKKLLRYLVSKGHDLDEASSAIENISRREDDSSSLY